MLHGAGCGPGLVIDIFAQRKETKMTEETKNTGGELHRSQNEIAGIDFGAGALKIYSRWGGIDTSLKPSDVNVCFEYTLKHVDIDTRFNDFYVGSCAPGGYIWVFIKGPDSANVGIGVQLSKIKAGERNSLISFVKLFIFSNISLIFLQVQV
jgi:hypothetical protein